MTLRNAGLNVIGFTERFERGTNDEVWLLEVRDRGWVVLTRDDQWRYNPAERRAFIRAKARAFVFVPIKPKAPEIADIIWRALPEMVHIVDTTAAPFIFRILADASLEPIFPRPPRK